MVRERNIFGAVALALIGTALPTSAGHHCVAGQFCPCIRDAKGPVAKTSIRICLACGPTGHSPCADKKVRWKTSRYRTLSFASCAAAAKWIASADEIALTEIEYAKQPNLRVQYNERPNGAVVATTTLQFELDQRKTTMHLPRIEWPNMTTAEKEAVDFLNTSIATHEYGHIEVAETTAARHSVDWESDPSSSRTTARANLQAKIQDAQLEAQTDLDRVAGDDGAYDEATDHGRKQSRGPSKSYPAGDLRRNAKQTRPFPGGEDVKLQCPARQ